MIPHQRVTALTALLTLAACAADHQVDAGMADDAAIALDAGTDASLCTTPIRDCRLGLFFGTCDDGPATPTLACNEVTGACRWFSSSACPEGWRRSDCPAEEACCHATPTGRWPFSDEVPRSDMAIVEMGLDLAAMGLVGIDAERPTPVAVTVDASFTAPPQVTATCSPGATLLLCESRLFTMAWVRAMGLSRVVELVTGSPVGQRVLVELLPRGSGLGARVFVRDFTDAARPSTPRACPPPSPRASVVGLTLDSGDPARLEVHGELTLALEDGESATVAF